MEGYTPSSYGDGMASVYDDLYRIQGTDQAVARLAEWVAASSLLELGAGTGRLAIPLHREGIPVVAVDSSGAMLDVLRRTPGGGEVETVISDMRHLTELGQRQFDFVLIAYSTFFQLVGNAEKRDSLRSIHRLTHPSSELIIEAFVPDLSPASQNVEVWRVEAQRLVLSASATDAVAQVTRGQVLDFSESGFTLRPWAVHYLTPQQLDELAAAEGWHLAGRWANWALEPFASKSRQHISRYVRQT